jgi:site-specific recombinase XerC
LGAERSLLDEFRRYLRDERNASPHSVRAYLSVLDQGVAFMKEDGGRGLASARPEEVRAWLARMLGPGPRDDDLSLHVARLRWLSAGRAAAEAAANRPAGRDAEVPRTLRASYRGRRRALSRRRPGCDARRPTAPATGRSVSCSTARVCGSAR